MGKDALLIFTRNPIYGKVKTRLAAFIGNDKALEVYRHLIEHTASMTKSINATRIVYYSEFIANGDAWDNTYLKNVQQGADLGERMSSAFNDTLKYEHKKAVIIGTDCYGLNEAIITEAFEQLDNYDVVIGPAQDGGYYLLGMKTHHPQLFENITWSTETVLSETLACCNKSGLTYFLLPVLNDIDDEQDLISANLFQKS